MFRAALWTLRQPRYAAMAAVMFLLAVVCVGAGTFELHRYHEKERDNQRLSDNQVAAVVPLSSRLVPVTGRGPAPDALDVRYRGVSVTGLYLPGRQTYLDDQTRHGRQGFYVLTPLRTQDGILLVARGFVAATSTGHRPERVAAPPTGVVNLVGRLATASGSDDRFGALGRGEITSVHPAQQAGRLGEPVYQAFLDLDARQPGSAGLQPLPDPPISNPTGGASEWQLLSYVVQWYTFAVLALLAPFLICRNEVREARRRFLGVEELDVDQRVDEPAALPGGDPGAALALRSTGTLAERSGVSVQRYERAQRLADRYGRSLGPQHGGAPAAPRARPAAATTPVRDSGAQAHRSEGDDYHGSYNDYLWQLALRDGGLPAGPDVSPTEPAAPEPPALAPRVIDAEPGEGDDHRDGDRPGDG